MKIYIPKEIMQNEQLSLTAKKLYGLLLEKQDDHGQCQIAMSSLAITLECDKAKIRKALQELVMHNLILIAKHPTTKQNVYYVFEEK